MSYLVKRLRGQRLDGRSTDETMLEAADEIERLRRENERLRGEVIAANNAIAALNGSPSSPLPTT